MRELALGAEALERFVESQPIVRGLALQDQQPRVAAEDVVARGRGVADLRVRHAHKAAFGGIPSHSSSGTFWTAGKTSSCSTTLMPAARSTDGNALRTGARRAARGHGGSYHLSWLRPSRLTRTCQASRLSSRATCGSLPARVFPAPRDRRAGWRRAAPRGSRGPGARSRRGPQSPAPGARAKRRQCHGRESPTLRTRCLASTKIRSASDSRRSRMAASDRPRWPSVMRCSASNPRSRSRRISARGKFSSRRNLTRPWQRPAANGPRREPHSGWRSATARG